MLKRMKSVAYFTCIFFLFFSLISEAESNDFDGTWKMINEKSTEIDLYGALSVEFHISGDQLTLIHQWGVGRSFRDSINLNIDSNFHAFEIHDRVVATNVFMGLSMPVGEQRQIKATWEKPGAVLKLVEQFNLISSQGRFPETVTHHYTLSADKEIITYDVNRASRKTGPKVRYVLKKEGIKNAWYMELEDNWEISGKLPTQAFLISLQGLANATGPNLYFVYPSTWDFRFTPNVLEFLKNERHYTFNKLATAEQALQRFKENVHGYVVWDKDVRTSLIVSFTVAGLEQAIVVSEEMIPLVEKFGLKKVEDFRGKFTGQSDAQIYAWAYEQYWNRCSKEYIVWMGGEHGAIMKPGVADWGIFKRAFFNDLSTKVTDTEEYALANKLLSEMKPLSYVFGWHSYKKDKERDHVTLTSSYSLRVEGLHTLPNMSFSSQVPASPGFTFKNNHNIVPGKTYSPKKKVYISCIQTDCLGLGAWTRPGRGQLPYAWEVTMNWSWLAPAMMEYFYTQATPNDFFIGSLSGPGYMYPKAIPKETLPAIIDIAYDLMKKLDLNVFEIMDYSQGATVEGNTELPRDVVDVYYERMPGAIGFANGYSPSFTFTSRDGRPFLSFDYYLSPTRTEADAAADLQELATINSQRPYFLLMHVRQWSDITRVKAILDNLGPEFEVVPLDIFIKMAGAKPTFKERFLNQEMQ
ncbi:MAG: GxGYxYP domain-containing protein [Candidatus Zhuqueibacterota bacterium]